MDNALLDKILKNMLKPEQAKNEFRNLLLWLILAMVWPILSIIIATVFGITGFKAMSTLLMALSLVWLAIYIWLVFFLWRLSQHVQVTPWASLWVLCPLIGVFLIGMLYLEPLKYIRDNKPANKRLPSTWGLIKESIRFAYKVLGDSSKTTIWYLYISLATGASSVLVLLWQPYFILHLIFILALTVLTAWVSIKLLLELAVKESGGSPTGNESDIAKNSLAGYFVMNLLAMLITAGPLLASFVVSFVLMALAGFGTAAAKDSSSSSASLFSLMVQSGLPIFFVGLIFIMLFVASVVWAIYKTNQYTFIMPVLVLEGRLHAADGTPNKGLFKIASETLTESDRLVKGRWWGVFWKNQLFGATVGFIIVMVMEILMLILLGLVNMIVKDKTTMNVITNMFVGVLNGAAKMLIIPLVFIFQIKLYRAFKLTA